MACTYDVTTDIGKVRLYIMDVDCTADVYKFENAEIQVFLDDGGSVWAAAGLALMTWAAELARDDELVRTGSWTGDRRDVAGKMNKKAKEFMDLAGFDPGKAPHFVSAPIDWDLNVKTERELTEDI